MCSRSPRFYWIIVSGALVNFNLYALGTFSFPRLLGRVHHLQVGKANIATGTVYLVGGLLGGIFGGHWGDRIARHRPDGRLLIAAIAAFVAGACLHSLVCARGFGSLYMAVVFLTAAYGLLNMYYGLVYASIQDIVAPAVRGNRHGDLLFWPCTFWALPFGPVITGKLSDNLAHRACGRLPAR